MQILGLATVIAAGYLLSTFGGYTNPLKQPLDLLIAAGVMAMLYEAAAVVVRFLNVHFVNEYSRIVFIVVSTIK